MNLTKSRIRNTRWLALLGASTIALGTSLGTWAWEDAKSAAPAGLRGILPEEAPASLNEDAFAALDGNWQDWGTKAAAEVAKLYSAELTTLEAQRLQLEVVKIKLSTLESSLKDSRYRSIHETLTGLRSELSRRVGLAEAALDTLTLDTKRVAAGRVDRTRSDLVNALSQLEAELKLIKNGPGWLNYIRAAEVSKILSEKQGLQAGAQLVEVQNKLIPTDATSPEVRKFLDRPNLVAFRSALDSHLQALAAFEQPVNQDQLRAALATLIAAIEKYEETHASADGIAVRKAFDAVRAVSPDGGQRIASAMSTHYFNYNLRVAMSEKFLDRLIRQSKVVEGQVVDCILGANVSGHQTTDTQVTVDLKPSNNGIRIAINLNGHVQSNTVGVTDQASVYTFGNHHFHAWKTVIYDGNRFYTEPADVNVFPNNNTTGIETSFSGIPLLGHFADSFALGKVEEKRPEAEAIAAQRVASRVLPEFNKEVDDKFSEMNRSLDTGINARLKKKDLFPSATSYRSSDSELRANLRLMGDQELGGSDGPYASIPSNGFVVALHESMLNASMARLKIGGRTMQDDQLTEEIEKSFSELLDRPFKASKAIEAAGEAKTDSATFVFPEKDPIQFRIENGALALIIRAGLKQTGEEDIPTQEISVPLKFSVSGNHLLVERGDIGVSPVEPPTNTALQITRAGIIRKKVSGTLPPRKFDRFITIDKDVPKPITVGVSSVKAAGGWLVLSFE